MPDATAGQAVTSAQAHLNDRAGTIWPFSVLLPFLQEAHRELRAQVILNGIPVIDEVTASITVPIGTTDLTTCVSYPTDMIVPIWMKERPFGETNSDYVDMIKRDFIPNADQTTWLIWWSWRGEKIYLLGSLIAEQVQLRYRRQIPTPVSTGDSLGWLQAENYLSYRTAALACNSIGEMEKGSGLTEQANVNLDTIIRLNVKEIQGMPARRRPYHRRYANNTIIRGM